jgi:hypothetical protein
MLYSIGLGGDGDEVDAVQLVERRMHLSLDYADAPNWRTAGDLFNAVVRAKPELEGSRIAWRRMSVALCWYTGANLRHVVPTTILIDDTTLWQQLTSLWGRLRNLGKKNV